MKEKEMVLDVLQGMKAGLINYTKIINDSLNPKLRETYQRIRTGDEDFQYTLSKLATEKGFLSEPKECSIKDVTSIKAHLTEQITERQGAGPIMQI